MARQIDSLVVITGDLLAENPIHVGGTGGAIETDLPLAVDGTGRFYVPGTSLAGAIRSWLDRAESNAHDPVSVNDSDPGQGPSRQVWGHGRRPGDVARIEKPLRDAQGRLKRPLNPAERARRKRAEGIASRVVVRDAYLMDAKVAAEIRDHVGIDRYGGVAAEGIKYDRQILPKGTRLRFSMEVELAKRESALPGDQLDEWKRDPTKDRERIAAAVDALCRGQVRFGGAKTRGLGKLKLVGATKIQHDTNNRKGVLALVKSRAPARGSKASAAKPPALGVRMRDDEIDGLVKAIAPGYVRHTPPILRVTIDWRPDGPVMVKSGSDGLGVDMLPLVSGVDGQLAMVLPGSAIKGRLRAHAEMIAATVLRKAMPAIGPQTRASEAFNQCLGRVPLVKTLFGVPGPKKGDEMSAGELGLGAVFIDDCFAEGRSLAPEKWEALVAAPKDANDGMIHVRKALGDAGWTGDDPAAHVAIDRWTGGSADGMLYSALEPRGVAWSPIEIEVALDRLKAPPDEAEIPEEDDAEGRKAAMRAREELWRDAAVALFYLTLRDFATGRVPLGFGGNRGYGAVTVTGIGFKVEGLVSQSNSVADALARLTQVRLGERGVVEGAGGLEALDGRWREYVSRYRTSASNSSNDRVEASR